jgi:hypothetical protein
MDGQSRGRVGSCNEFAWTVVEDTVNVATASLLRDRPSRATLRRGLRGAVIYRKLSLGSQSEQGERTIERLLSASVTCRLQGRSLFAYLSDVLSAKIRGDPIPLLA